MQTTIGDTIAFEGVGLHSGEPVTMRVLPAQADFGIWFKRTDVPARRGFVAASWETVKSPRLCTRLVNEHGVEISTTEHIMAALAGCGVHNAMIELSGPEIPILDGSAAPFVEAIIEKGLRELAAPVRVIRIKKTITVENGSAVATLKPFDGFAIDFRIEFSDPAIGTQECSFDLANGAFVRELCDSRTFCRLSEVEMMREAGLARGGNYENAVVVDGDRILSPGGLRRADEAVRHKMLDVMGDLALAGLPIQGRYVGLRSGHATTNMVLRALFSDPGAYEIVECDPVAAGRLPGAGVCAADMPSAA